MEKWFTDKTKFWKVMKICATQAMIAMILVGISMAHNSDGQLLETKISISLNGVSLEHALSEIERIAKVKFVYSESQLDLKAEINFVADNQTLDHILSELLTPYRIKYKVHEKEATITLKGHVIKDSPDQGSKRAIVTGKVTDVVTNQPLVGVNVIIKGTTSGTTTDAEGNYSLEANEGDKLVFSFIGYISFETQIDSRSVIDVVLQEDTKNLNEVVVNAGYWTVKEKEQTGNISRITTDEIRTQPIVNPLQAMSGRMAGVFISQETGVAGGGIQVQIRGRNSISNGNDPLYIIDGVPVLSTSLKSSFFGAGLGTGSPFSTLNPNDIESIEVLKDGAATAIYGSRGANGVILITTKKGQAGKTKLDVSVSTGFSQVASKMKLLNTSEYLTMRREAFRNDNLVPTTSNAYDLILWDTTRYTDWQKELIGKTARVVNANASISGGDKYTQFLFGLGYYSESMVYPGDFGFTRGTGSLNLNHKSLNERFKITLALNYQLENNRRFNGDLTNAALITQPNGPEGYTDGALNWGPSLTFGNPYANLLRKYNIKTNNFRVNSQISYDILSSLVFKANLGYTTIQTDSYASSPGSAVAGGATSSANFGTGQNNTWILEPQLDYRKKFQQSSFSALLGVTFQSSLKNTTSLRGSGYIDEQLLDNLQSAATITVNDATTIKYRYSALFGRINYTLKEKYILDVIGRRDGSSRFGPDNRFANFGSISSAWIFSNENFFRRAFRFVSFGKLRASLGSSGNDQIGDYGYLDTYLSTGTPYQGTPGLSPARLANPNYSWETNTKFETGIELGLIDDRIFLTVSYYRNRSSSQLVGLPLSSVTGFTSIQANLAATVENSGVELEVSTTNVRKGNFSWTSSLNFTLPKNKLLEYQNINRSTNANRYVIGQPITIDKVYKFEGVDPQTGTYRFLDVDGDNSVTSPTDNQTIINTAPTTYGGLNNNFKYKNWSLGILFQFVQQKGTNYLTPFSMPGFQINQPFDVLQRWQNPGSLTGVQRFSTSTGVAYTAFTNATRSELNYDDASYIRLKNVFLSYQLPKKLADKAGMRKSEIFIQGQNLLTLTNYKGLDPETRSYVNLPPLKTIAFGVNVTF